VEAIVEAAARVLGQRGYDGATTRRIAECAGVSVGSLYQYFPSRDALVTMVLERHVDEVIDGVGTLLRGLEAAPFDAVIRRLVARVLEIHARDPGLHAILYDELPSADRTPLLARMNRALVTHLAAFLERRPEVPRFDVRRAVSVLGRACIPLVHASDRGPGGGGDRLADDLFLLVIGYLRALAGGSDGLLTRPKANDASPW
jgi:AcrR family transcriptional regulator